MRTRSGRLVVLGIFLLAVGGAVALNLATRGTPKLPHGVRVLTSPSSATATAGRTDPVRLLSPCAPAVDFDASYWEPETGGTKLDQPAEPATIRLVDPDRAVLRTAAGQSFTLARVAGPIALSRCP
ncbi:MAG: hypothetical protein M3Q23_14995 [Actinomycetota bacterium]|nr:hypothetical protein [Actinomycetota bacterium]